MSNSAHGRHRAPGSANPVSSLSAALARTARPALSIGATVAAAGGMVAALSGPASAAPAAQAKPAAESVVLSGTTAAKASYGQQIVDPAAVASRKSKSKSYKTVTVASRTAKAATPVVAKNVGAASTAASVQTGVLNIAAGLSGIPYVWGGTTTRGFDCSGFTQYVFRQAGISLPRTAAQQRAATRYVSNPVPGDLVFFGTYHVGIYAGNGMMYDAPTAGSSTGLHRIWSSAVTYGRV